MNLAIIPARGGSKRIPGKNVREFAGKPLIAYSIQAAVKSELFDEVVVSTDDPLVADIARQYGASVPFLRPSELSNDHIGTFPVVQHGIRFISDTGRRPDFVCCIYATAPFIQIQSLREGFEKLRAAEDKHFAFSVTTFAFPIQRALRLAGEGVEPIQPSNMSKRSQDLEEAYHDAGQFYWGRTEAFLEGKSTFSQSSIPVILPRHLVQDIDTQEDWHRAELMYQAYVRGMQND